MIFYYIRHGHPVYQPDSLTELGHKQANALAKRLALYGLDEIYCSTSTRAKMTADPVCKILNKEKILLDWTNEDYTWQYFSIKNKDGNPCWVFHSEDYIQKFKSAEVRKLDSHWYQHPYFENHNFSSGIQKTNDELDRFLLSLGYRHDRQNNRYEVIHDNQKRVALFAHQGFGLVFLSSLMDIPYPTFCTSFDLGHSSVTAIHFENKNGFAYPKILQLSNDSHLYKEDLLTGYQNLIDL